MIALTKSTISLMVDYLKDLGDVVGLRLNLNKFNIYFAELDDRIRTRLSDIMGFQQGTLPFRYLGILLAMEKLRANNYGALIDTFICKLTSWPKHILSYARKLELVKTVL